ncbi:G-alpha-domain-containing protein [Auriscalpium vulgare]|uniref:G-alpha-domain-containing protein n=1 Tax=Auriscalpium vulgare TaxID=40419 RepID=A0ACB8SAM5_9AGAM|nr:G-alpha-domain-containing protein [Auriscalpium vulgare]
MPRLPSAASTDDPLSLLVAPPPDEDPVAREARLRSEMEARRISDQIDEELAQERLAARRGPRPIKLLLLGQSESGKSTTLKNFQLMASPKAFRTERVIWRAVIQLNVVRSIHLILNTISDARLLQKTTRSPSHTPSPSYGSRPTSPTVADLTSEHARLQLSLSPLVRVEEALVRKLQLSAGQPALDAGVAKEVALNSTSGWKGNFVGRVLARRSGEGGDEDDGIDWDDPNDPGRVINACGEDMMRLWEDPVVRELLDRAGVRLREMSGFFLDDLDRVTSLRYVPTDDDIMRARIKTLGVSEHRFKLSSSSNVLSRDWVIFDVGGHRSLRAAWVPYFDDMNAIIFLAPISCFDQTLEEDEKVNRLEDSVLLWRSIVSNRLLTKTNMVLFLNKCDILKEKLGAGVPFAKYITSYGKRPNTFDATSSYLKRKFQATFVDHSPEPRPFFCHLTSVTDTKQMSHILLDVSEFVLRENLSRSALV